MIEGIPGARSNRSQLSYTALEMIFKRLPWPFFQAD